MDSQGNIIEGSPPQVRGKLVDIVVWVVGLRITPAGAGKTSRVCFRAWVLWDHPRRCGENGKPKTHNPRTKGSPPQVRGKPPGEGSVVTYTRITPAGAGKTITAQVGTFQAKDHPRRCGENRTGAAALTRRMGSPPQVRGKLAVSGFFAAPVGITPAGAGKTIRRCPESATARDHPRRCGENFTRQRGHVLQPGSPPQVRGKQSPCCGDYRAARITPAGAGKTAHADGFADFVRDHPRRCGENPVTAYICSRVLGSPPQVRGKLLCWFCKNCLHRITPAGAGKTRQRGKVT